MTDGSRRRSLAAERRRIALRSLALQSVWNYESLQSIGFAWSLVPTLERLYPEPARRAERLLAHIDRFNANPYLGTIGSGVAARLEQEVARGSVGAAHRLERLLKALRSPLGALGDELFWAGLRPALATGSALIALVTGWWGVALVFVVAFNVFAQAVRWRGVRAGFASGAGIARVLQDPFWSRATLFSRTVGAVFAGAVVGWIGRWVAVGGEPRIGALFLFTAAFLWLADQAYRKGARWLSPPVALLAAAILLSILDLSLAGVLP